MLRFVLSVLMLIALPAFGANFSGKWVIQSPSQVGNDFQTVMLLNQAGTSVSGTVSNAGDVGTGSPVNTEVYDSKVDGDTISFYVWRGTDAPAKLFYRGTLTSTGTIRFQVTGGPLRQGVGIDGVMRVPPVDQQVTAVRSR